MAGEPDMADDGRYVFKPGPNLPKLEFSSPGTNEIGWPQIWSIPVAETKTVITINPQRTGRVVMFGDSFAVKLQPFLSVNFGKVVLLRTYFSRSDVQRVQPVLVIDEVVERFLQ